MAFGILADRPLPWSLAGKILGIAFSHTCGGGHERPVLPRLAFARAGVVRSRHSRVRHSIDLAACPPDCRMALVGSVRSGLRPYNHRGDSAEEAALSHGGDSVPFHPVLR